MEYRRRCNVCGKIYCYSDKELSENTSNSAMAAISAIGGIASIFGGTRLDTYALNNQTDRYSSKVVDYNKCPSCNSSNTSLITDIEWVEMQQKETVAIQPQVIQTKKIDINRNATSDSLLKRTKMFLEEEDWDSASAYCEQILDIDPECAMAYVYKLMIELKVTEQDKLALLSEPFVEEKLYQKAVRFADDSLKAILEGYNYTIVERNKERAYASALEEYNSAKTEQDCKALIPKFKALGNYKDSSYMVGQCEEKAIICKYSHATQLQQRARTEYEFLEAKAEFDSICTYRDAGVLATACRDKAEEARKNAIYDGAVTLVGSSEIVTVENAVKEFEKIPGWKDADQKKIEALNRVEQLKKATNKKKTIYIISFAMVIICILVAIFIGLFIIPNNKYQKAKVSIENKNYENALSLLEEIVPFSDSETIYKETQKNYLSFLISNKEFGNAIEVAQKYQLLDSSETDDLFVAEILYTGKYDNLRNAVVGDNVFLGEYKQNGDVKEPVEWIVLAKENGALFLLSKKCLMYDYVGGMNWADSILREKLNNEYFIDMFNSEERSIIQTTEVQYEILLNDEELSRDFCYDKMFILSESEVEKYVKNNMREPELTTICKKQGADDSFMLLLWVLRDCHSYNGEKYDYLSSECYYSQVIGEDGQDGCFGTTGSWDDRFVRPAIWVTVENQYIN